MLIDHVKIRRRGVGLCVLLGITVLFSLAAVILAFVRVRRIRLNRVPQVLLFGRFSLGSSLFWGFLIFIIGFMFCLVGFTEREDMVMMSVIFVPQALAGVLLTYYWFAYRGYKCCADALLERIAAKRRLTADDLCITIPGRTFKSEKTTAVLQDLNQEGSVAFTPCPDGGYEVWITSTELIEYLEKQMKIRRESVKTISWTCPLCGASNTTPEDGVCEYCGSGCCGGE